jgi:hypothetical protein
MIHDRKDGIVPVTFRQLSDQVHRHDFKRLGAWGNCDFVKWGL